MKAQKVIDYFPSGTQFSQEKVQLSWTDDDRLRMQAVDSEGRLGAVHFDVPVSAVTVRGSMSVPKFLVDGVGYRVDFSADARTVGAHLAGVGAGSEGAGFQVASLALTAEAVAASGAQQWMDALKAAGANVRYWTTGKVIAAGAIAAGLVIALAIVGVVIAAVLNPASIYG